MDGRAGLFMWCINMNADLQRNSDVLWERTETWRINGGFKHKKPCSDWLQGKRCSHYAKARTRHFKLELNELLSNMGL